MRAPFGHHRDNRLVVAMALGALLIAPAAGLRLACVGASCDGDDSGGGGQVPFCSLTAETQALISAGFYDGRSPEVLGVTTAAGSIERADLAWPSMTNDDRVPLVFAGDGVKSGPQLAKGTRIDRIAPTVARLVRFERPYPMLERARPIRGVSTTRMPRLIVEIGLKGIGTPDLEAAPGLWPALSGLMRTGVGTLEASVGSVPLDPAAVLTTVGTGSLPSQHGITGTLIRDWEGDLASAWSSSAPVSAIATLAEDLDHRTDQRSLVGLIADAPTDRGLIGGEWYVDHDRDVRTFEPTPADVVDRVVRVVADRFGDDPVPDVLGVVLDGPIGHVDRALGRLVDGVRSVVDAPVLFVVTGTGSAAHPRSLDSTAVERAIRSSVGDVLEGQVPGGLFVDADGLAAADASRQDVREALLTLADEDGRPVMADSFLSYSVAFGKYC